MEHILLPLDEAITSRAVFVIYLGRTGGRTDFSSTPGILHFNSTEDPTLGVCITVNIVYVVLAVETGGSAENLNYDRVFPFHFNK